MLNVQHISLRDRLRQETTEDHDRVDALFGTLDLKAPHPLGQFLAAHRAGFAAMHNAMPDETGFVGRDMLSEMIAAIDTDLTVLNTPAPVLATAPFSFEALDHIVLGSRLGTAVLKREWSASNDPLVTRASHYFSLPGRGDLWRAHTDALKERAPETGDHIVEDVRQLYRLFEKAYHCVE